MLINKAQKDIYNIDITCRINLTEWLFVRARTDRILATCTVYDYVTIRVASRDKLR